MTRTTPGPEGMVSEGREWGMGDTPLPALVSYRLKKQKPLGRSPVAGPRPERRVGEDGRGTYLSGRKSDRHFPLASTLAAPRHESINVR
jgi:hypothetical protein